LSPSLAEQARAFAEPILATIAARPPDYEDDFSDPGSGWDIGTQSGKPNVTIRGETGYIDGTYFVRADKATLADPMVCAAGQNWNKLGQAADFVLEADAAFVSGEGGDWQVQFHRWEKPNTNKHGLYALLLGYDEVIGFHRCESGGECLDLAYTTSSAIKGGTEWNHFRLIVRGLEMAAYVNGEPILYVNDSGYSEDFRTGRFSLDVCNPSEVPAEAKWDNLKIWDISDLALP
jgi:hypothetical protein